MGRSKWDMKITVFHFSIIISRDTLLNRLCIKERGVALQHQHVKNCSIIRRSSSWDKLLIVLKQRFSNDYNINQTSEYRYFFSIEFVIKLLLTFRWNYETIPIIQRALVIYNSIYRTKTAFLICDTSIEVLEMATVCCLFEILFFFIICIMMYIKQGHQF